MDTGRADGAAGRAGFSLHPLATVWLLGLTQIVGYGTIYYSFAILAEDVAVGFSWPVSWLYGSLSLGLLAGGLIAPEVGRRIDRHGSGAVMTLGSLLCAGTLLLAALAPNGIVFVLANIVTQTVATMSLYDAAFAALVQTCGLDARKRITHLTLVAGFASTIFWPMTSWLHGVVGWREIYAGFALANLVLCLPVHAMLALQHRHKLRAASIGAYTPEVAEPLDAGQRRLLWLVTIGFALSGFALSAILAQLVPMLTALGLGASALLVSMLFGPAQVAIRFINMILGAQRHPIQATIIAVGMVPLALGILTISAPWAIGAVAFALLLGFGSGLKSIVQGTLPLALFGSKSYGARIGAMASFRQILAAIAPFSLALAIEGIGVGSALWLVAGVGLLGLGCMIEVARTAGRARAPTAEI